MAQLLFKQGDFRILSDDVGSLSAEEMNQLIKTAGTTCYQTRETSKKTPEEFIRMLQTKKHYAMLEHSWYTFEITTDIRDLSVVILSFFRSNNLFCITPRPRSFLVSGNSRMFNEAYTKPGGAATGKILSVLTRDNPVLFPGEEFETDIDFDVIEKPALLDKNEILTHRAMTVEFNNHCRGFTHEDARSRNGDEKITSYAQESTRYVDYSRGEVDLEQFQIKFILPYNDRFDFTQRIHFKANGADYFFTPQQFTNMIEAWYRALRKKGLKAEEARQWLPIGLKSQIVQTYNLREWRHWFHLRADAPAHPEIRWSAVRLLKEVQRRIPDVFDDFEFKTKPEDNSEYAVYTGSDPLV